MCYIHEGEVIKGTICSLYMDNGWYSDLNSRSISLEFDIADTLAMRYLAFAISSDNVQWEVLHVQDKQNNVVANVTIPDKYDGAVKLGVKLYDTPPSVGSVLNVGFDYVITGGIDLADTGNSKIVTMTCATAGASIRYTLDGAEPTEESTEYAGEFEVDHSCTVKARAFKDDFEPSDIAIEEIEVIKTPTNWVAISDLKLGDANNNPVMCYGGGKFVIFNFRLDTLPDVGQSMASYSTDGITWTAISNTKTKLPVAVVYGNDKFVAVDEASNSVYSFDGITWNNISDIKLSADGLIYADGKFVAFGDNKASCSTDGITWTGSYDLKLSNVTSAIFMCYGGGKFVAWGQEIKFPSFTVSIKASYSTDGITWTAISDMKLGDDPSGFNAVYGGGKFIAYTTTSASYSTDGINWTAISDLELDVGQGICYGGGKFIAYNYTSASYSTDGINWTAISDSKVFGVNDMFYVDGFFIATKSDGTGVYSTDGISWNVIEDMKLPTGIINIGLVYGNGTIVAIGIHMPEGELRTIGSYCIM